MRSVIKLTVLSFVGALGFAGCAGVEAEGPELGTVSQQLGQLPDCAAVSPTFADFSDFEAAPTTRDDVYTVRTRSAHGLTAVCTTDFDGLETFAHRVELGDPIRAQDRASSDPMPGHGTNPAASDPMPGRDASPAASDPMPGRDASPASSDPMPGRGSNPAASDPMPGRDANPGSATVVGRDTPNAHLYRTVKTQ